MKRIFEQAAELFRQNEIRSDESFPDLEKAKLYQGLALLAEGLQKLERRLDQMDTGNGESSMGSFRSSSLKPRRRIRIPIIVVPSNP